MAGYSGTPLPQKLGIKSGAIVVAINAPANYKQLLGKCAREVSFTDRAGAQSDFIHLFVLHRSKLEKHLKDLRRKLADAGTLWVSWPKKASSVPTDVTEDVIREAALPLGFVDVKVCAVDETWSGLKLVIRRSNRKQCSSSSRA